MMRMACPPAACHSKHFERSTRGRAFLLVIDRPQDALKQRVEFRQCVELFRQVSVPIVDALDASDHIGQNAGNQPNRPEREGRRPPATELAVLQGPPCLD